MFDPGDQRARLQAGGGLDGRQVVRRVREGDGPDGGQRHAGLAVRDDEIGVRRVGQAFGHEPCVDIGNAVQVFFKDGSCTARVAVDFPIGHRKRRAEGMPVLVKKFQASVDAHFNPKQAERIKTLFAKGATLDVMPINELMAALVSNGTVPA